MKNILSIDGGGVRCYLSLRLLDEIENKTKVPICKLFDYFTGVSASSLIISLLLIKNVDGSPKFTTSQILFEFEQNCKGIFDYSYFSLLKTGWGLLGPKYNHSKFQKILLDNFGNTTLDQLSKPVCFLTYDLDNGHCTYFSNHENVLLLVSQCILCSTTAPTYFYPYIYNDHSFIDGGVITNNPAQLCFIKAAQHYKDDDFYTLSIGTGYCIERKSFTYGLVGWSQNIINTLYNANNSSQLKQLNILDMIISREKTKNVFHRIDFELEKVINLDDVNAFKCMEKIMDDWICKNTQLIDKLCEELLENYK